MGQTRHLTRIAGGSLRLSGRAGPAHAFASPAPSKPARPQGWSRACLGGCDGRCQADSDEPAARSTARARRRPDCGAAIGVAEPRKDSRRRCWRAGDARRSRPREAPGRRLSGRVARRVGDAGQQGTGMPRLSGTLIVASLTGLRLSLSRPEPA